jgi:ribosomal protein S18 acetylase RimI-like enzyme
MRGDPPPFTLRDCTPDDAGVLAALGARLFRQTYAETHPEPAMSRHVAHTFDAGRLRAELAAGDAHALLVEDDAGVAVGYAQLRATTGAPPKGVVGARPWEILRFYVDAAWHGRGPGHALMAACVAEARRRDADVLWVQAWQRADRALAFYRRHGFVVVATAKFPFGDRFDDDFIMARHVRRPDTAPLSGRTDAPDSTDPDGSAV